MEITEANREERMPLLSKAETPGLAVLDPPTRRRQPKESRRTRQLASPRLKPEQHLDESGSPGVRLLMSDADAQALANLLSSQTGTEVEQRILDQLWLRTALIEQWRRARILDRPDFELRANHILSALDPYR
jgi:hypothetical protein